MIQRIHLWKQGKFILCSEPDSNLFLPVLLSFSCAILKHRTSRRRGLWRSISAGDEVFNELQAMWGYSDHWLNHRNFRQMAHPSTLLNWEWKSVFLNQCHDQIVPLPFYKRQNVRFLFITNKKEIQWERDN